MEDVSYTLQSANKYEFPDKMIKLFQVLEISGSTENVRSLRVDLLNGETYHLPKHMWCLGEIGYNVLFSGDEINGLSNLDFSQVESLPLGRIISRMRKDVPVSDIQICKSYRNIKRPWNDTHTSEDSLMQIIFGMYPYKIFREIGLPRKYIECLISLGIEIIPIIIDPGELIEIRKSSAASQPKSAQKK